MSCDVSPYIGRSERLPAPDPLPAARHPLPDTKSLRDRGAHLRRARARLRHPLAKAPSAGGFDAQALARTQLAGRLGPELRAIEEVAPARAGRAARGSGRGVA